MKKLNFTVLPLLLALCLCACSVSMGTSHAEDFTDRDLNSNYEKAAQNIASSSEESTSIKGLKADGQIVLTGGVFIGTGASGMAQSFAVAEQGIVALRVGSQSAKTKVVLADESGREVLSCTPNLAYSVVIFSSPDICFCDSYTLRIGSQEVSVKAQ